jgi:hypothetical protein
MHFTDLLPLVEPAGLHVRSQCALRVGSTETPIKKKPSRAACRRGADGGPVSLGTHMTRLHVVCLLPGLHGIGGVPTVAREYSLSYLVCGCCRLELIERAGPGCHALLLALY